MQNIIIVGAAAARFLISRLRAASPSIHLSTISRPCAVTMSAFGREMGLRVTAQFVGWQLFTSIICSVSLFWFCFSYQAYFDGCV